MRAATTTTTMMMMTLSLVGGEVVALLDYNFAMQSEDRLSPVDETFEKIKGKNAKPNI